MTNQDKMNQIVEMFIALLENDEAGNWIKPWMSNLPMNYASKTAYKGFNIIALAMEAEERQFSSNSWMTFNQAKKLKGHIKQGEKGTPVFFFKPMEVKKETEEGETITKTIPLLKSYMVFNIDQIEGIDECGNEVECVEAIDEFVAKSDAVIRTSPDKAYYSPSEDYIAMPAMERFKDTDGYYATLLHELTHMSGHPTRLNRDLSGTFGSEKYAFEELVAELGSAFLCSHLGIDLQNAQHPQYLQSWIKMLRENPKVLWKASSKAQQAFEYLREL